MATATPAATSGAGSERAEEQRRVADLLGGPGVLQHEVRSLFDAHDVIAAGMPGGAVEALLTTLHVLTPADVERALRMSVRTLQRRKGAPDRPLDADQGGRAWTLARILAKATDVFGTQQEAERWLDRPALALDGRRPLDLLGTPVGVGMVEDLLVRLEFGVYT